MIIAGIIVTVTVGFNKDLNYNIIATNNKEKDNNKIAEKLLKNDNIVSINFRED